MKKLNIGCGTDIRDGYVNLDIANLPGVDVVHDLNTLPLPFESNLFDEILCKDVLEHVEYIPLLKELHRILSEHGQLFIRVPHFSAWNNFGDPTHKKLFSFRTFNFFVKTNNERSYYFDFHFNSVTKVKITFNRILQPFSYLVNLNKSTQAIYESTGLRSLIPAQNIEITIKK